MNFVRLTFVTLVDLSCRCRLFTRLFLGFFVAALLLGSSLSYAKSFRRSPVENGMSPEWLHDALNENPRERPVDIDGTSATSTSCSCRRRLQSLRANGENLNFLEVVCKGEGCPPCTQFHGNPEKCFTDDDGNPHKFENKYCGMREDEEKNGQCYKAFEEVNENYKANKNKWLERINREKPKPKIPNVINKLPAECNKLPAGPNNNKYKKNAVLRCIGW